MSSPKLIRSVWLTSAQRQALSTYAEECLRKVYSKEVNDVLIELQTLESQKDYYSVAVKNFVKGLRLTKDSLPVAICTEAILHIKACTHIDENLLYICFPLHDKGVSK